MYLLDYFQTTEAPIFVDLTQHMAMFIPYYFLTLFCWPSGATNGHSILTSKQSLPMYPLDYFPTVEAPTVVNLTQHMAPLPHSGCSTPPPERFPAPGCASELLIFSTEIVRGESLAKRLPALLLGDIRLVNLQRRLALLAPPCISTT